LAHSSGLDVFLRLSAALVGTVPSAWCAGLALARWLPASDQARIAAGYFAPLPLYVVLACLAARARTGWRAWGACLLSGVLLALALIAAPAPL
jgi:hypothetical protein